MTPENEDIRADRAHNPGVASDASGNAVVDPTTNVLQLVQAANKRQDDLREAERVRVHEVADLRAKHSIEILDLRARLFEEGENCNRQVAELRADHAQQLREAEAKRIDAIREVDVRAVQAAADVQATQARILETNVAESAEAMRNQVAAAATAAEASQRAALEPIQRSIEDLRRSQSEGVGQKSQVTETREQGGSTALWIGLGISAVLLFLVLIGTVITIIVATQ